MSISMYQTSVPVFVRMLTNLSDILKKGQAFAEEKGIDPDILVGSRLRPDMYNLAKQIQIATDVSKGCVSRLAGEVPPSYEDNESSFPELLERLSKTIDHVQKFTPEQIDGTEEKTITLTLGSGDMSFPGVMYLIHFVQPNFFFHVTTAYNILRSQGVELGKMDFLGKPQ
ncbi:hypothetical protein A9Q99_12030 [Gammaproteobacteria bacterium 45_16_T64]|nr:hypothetical protein A9Q99_12030 [Gammaproteobacteria bacterium 45_16_T64]